MTDLRSPVELLDRLPELKEEPARPGWTPFRTTPEIDEHIAQTVAWEFVDRPKLCLAHAALIVRIRREFALSQDLPVFMRLWENERDYLARNLDSRWLISACDTFADHGDRFQRAAAIALVGWATMLKLSETERLLMVDTSYSEERKQAYLARHPLNIVLWDGVKAYATWKGDVMRNLLRRLDGALSADASLQLIGRTLIERAVQGDTLVRRLAEMNPRFLT